MYILNFYLKTIFMLKSYLLKVIVLVAENFGSWLGYEGGALKNGISVLIKEAPRES